MKYILIHTFYCMVAMASSMRSVFAFEANYYYGYEAIHSDNVRRAAVIKQTDTINRLAAGFDLREDGSVLQSHTITNINRDAYKNDTFENVLSGDLTTENILWISPKRFRWSFFDNLNYVPINAADPDTPNNYQQVNLFSTGPAATLNFTNVDSMELETRYENYSEETTHRDNVRYLYALRFIHNFDPVSVFGLNYEKRIYKFKYRVSNPPAGSPIVSNTNYDRDDFFTRYTARSTTTDYFIELGKTLYERDNNTSGAGLRGRVGLSRRITANKTISFYYRNELSDVAEELGTGSGIQTIIINGVPVSNSSDVFRVSGSDFVFESTAGGNIFNFRMFYSNLNYDITQDDQITKGALVNYTYTLTGRDRIVVDLGFTKRKYLDVNPKRYDDIILTGLAYRHYISSNMLLNFRIQKLDQESTSSANNILENIIGIGIRYQTQEAPR